MNLVRPGALYLVPTPLDFGCDPTEWAPIEDVLPARTLRMAARLTHWVTENAKSTRAFLKRVGQIETLAQPIQNLDIRELPRVLHKKGDFGATPTPPDDIRALLAPALAGHDMGLACEAGMPAVADPGALVVRMAHQLGLRVEVLVGPSSLIMALAASGLNGQHFAFVGYLPQSPPERVHRIRELESRALETGQTQVFIETPFRNQALLTSLTQTLRPTTRLAVSMGLTLRPTVAAEDTGDRTVLNHSAQVSEWRRSPPASDWHLPAVFAFGA